MKKMFTILVLCVFALSLAGAIEFNFKQMECQTLLGMKSEIIGTELPDKIPISTEIVNIYIADENFGYIQIEEKVVTNFACSENSAATYDLMIENENVIFEIYNSEDMLNTLNEKMKSKEIQLKGKTFGKKIKAGFAKIGLRVVSWFN